MHIKRTVTVYLGGLVAMGVLALFLGFGYFMSLVPATEAGRQVPPVGGMVIFTGGSGRIATGARVITRGFEGPVLVTGVYPGLKVDDLVWRRPLATDEKQRIELDYAALSTEGNVRETITWAHRHGLKSVLLVTSWYHMPRSLALLARSAPDLHIIPWPATSTEVPPLRLIAGEYLKFVAVRLGASIHEE